MDGANAAREFLAAVLAEKDPHYPRGNFCSAIRASRWRR